MKFSPIKQSFIIIIPSTLMLMTTVVLHLYFKISMYDIFRDPAAIAKMNPFAGFMSNLGVMGWWMAASICFFTAALLFKLKQNEDFWFIFSSALLSTYLALDDLFQFHDLVGWLYFRVQENPILITLAVVVLAYIIKFRHFIMRGNFLIFLLALGFFSASATVDHFQNGKTLSFLGEWRIFFEDGFKWIGIVFWCSYYALTCYQILCCNLKQLDSTSEINIIT